MVPTPLALSLLSSCPMRLSAQSCKSSHGILWDCSERGRTCTDEKCGLSAGNLGLFARWRTGANSILAEGVGFEPTRERKPPGGFQDRCLKPLGHPSNAVTKCRLR